VHGQAGFREELLRQQESPREDEVHGRDAKFAENDAADLAGAELELVGDVFDGDAALEHAFFNAPGELVGDAAAVVYRCDAGSELGPAAQARAEGFFFGGLGVSKEPAVARVGRFGRTDGAAVYAGGWDANKEK